jgi:hypothetical protein
MVGLSSSYALSPVVDWLARRRVPRALGAAILILSILGGTGAAIYSLADDANELIESPPHRGQEIARQPAQEDPGADHSAGHRAEGRDRAGQGGGRGGRGGRRRLGAAAGRRRARSGGKSRRSTSATISGAAPSGCSP